MIITAKLKSNFYLTSLTEILKLTFASKTFWQTVLVHFPTIFNSVTEAYCFSSGRLALLYSVVYPEKCVPCFFLCMIVNQNQFPHFFDSPFQSLIGLMFGWF